MTRDIAFDLLSRVENDEAYANLLLPTMLSRAGLEGRDAGFVQELAFGTIRNRLLYEKIIEQVSERKFPAIEPEAQLVLLLGAHQILGMRVPSHAALNETVNLARAKASKGAVGFVNAILRKLVTKSKQDWIDLVTSRLDKLEALSVEHSHPLWITNAFKAALVSRGAESELEALLVSNNTAPRVSLVALPGFSSIADFASEEDFGPASPIGVEISGAPSRFEEVRLGFARVQDQGSQLVTLALVDAELLCQDEAWLDICAGPGGKAALLASLSKQRRTSLVSNELVLHRAELVAKALEPLGVFQVTNLDGRFIGDVGEKYSRILLDAPCTGLGALRRRPEARWRRNTDDLIDLVRLQRQLIESAWRALLPGGVLAYVTCSPHLSETTGQVAWAQGKFGSELELLNANRLLNFINPDLFLDEDLQTTQLWPHSHATDAMFLALFRKSIN